MMRKRFTVLSVIRGLMLGSGIALAATLCGHSGALADEYAYKCTDIEKKSPLSSLGVEIYQGKGGWFARSGDLETMYEYPVQTMRMLVRINEALRAEGIHLILLPMLPRGIAGRNFLPDDGIFDDRIYDADFAGRQFDGLLATVGKAGIDNVNINRLLESHPEFDRNGYYFKRDIHWTPEAAHLVAGAVAEEIRKALPDNPNPVAFETPAPIGQRMNLSNMNKAINELCRDKIPGEPVNIYETKQSVDSVDALLSDTPDAEDHSVHVVGSSFTDEMEPYHFDGFLRQALSQNVDGFAVAGGGVTQSIYGWATSDAGIGKKPKVLVWEFNNASELIGVTPYLEQTLLPAIVGDCEAPQTAKSMDFKDKGSIDFDVGEAKASGSRYYIRYKFANNSLRSFKLTLNFTDKTNQVVTIANPNRVQDVDKLYYELPDDVSASVASVSLQISDGMTSSGTVKLCRYPDGIFSTATSN